MNQKGTTLTSLRKLNKHKQYEKIYNIVDHNCKALWRQLRWIAEQPIQMRLFRITSEFIPGSTLHEFDWIHRDRDFRELLEQSLAEVRDYADSHGIRLCTHPGQFTNICSDNPNVVERSIIDLEYHADLAALMGYGDTWHSSGFAINIHANYRQDPELERFVCVVENRLSPTARNLITVENDEFGCSVDQFVSSGISKHVALVLDIHHHWIQSGGKYITPEDPRIETFVDSWRGLRPLGHFSTSHEDVLINACKTTKPDYSVLEQQGFKATNLRAHSFGCWNQAVNDWAIDHLSWTDLEVEAKGKNIASRQLYERAASRGIIGARRGKST